MSKPVGIPISPSAQGRKGGFNFPVNSRYVQLELPATRNADHCRSVLDNLLENPTRANLTLAIAVYKYARDQSFFLPSGCSINSGNTTVDVGLACKRMAQSARAQLDALKTPKIQPLALVVEVDS